MVITSAKKPINTSYHSLFFHLILIFSLHCQLFLLISDYYTTCNIKITYQCKIIIVPEEGWFGQPKYSTHKKDPSTLCRLLLSFSSFYMWSRLDHYCMIQRTPAGSSFRLLALTFYSHLKTSTLIQSRWSSRAANRPFSHIFHICSICCSL